MYLLEIMLVWLDLTKQGHKSYKIPICCNQYKISSVQKWSNDQIINTSHSDDIPIINKQHKTPT